MGINPSDYLDDAPYTSVGGSCFFFQLYSHAIPLIALLQTAKCGL